jgi:hypothetical protein
VKSDHVAGAEPAEAGAPAAAKPHPFEAYYHEKEVAEARGVTTRALQAERQAGKGPPWLKFGKRVYYPISGWQQYLIEQQAIRRRAGGEHASPS